VTPQPSTKTPQSSQPRTQPPPPPPPSPLRAWLIPSPSHPFHGSRMSRKRRRPQEGKNPWWEPPAIPCSTPPSSPTSRCVTWGTTSRRARWNSSKGAILLPQRGFQGACAPGAAPSESHGQRHREVTPCLCCGQAPGTQGAGSGLALNSCHQPHRRNEKESAAKKTFLPT